MQRTDRRLLFSTLLAAALVAPPAAAQSRAGGSFPEGSAAITRVLLHFDPEACDGWVPACRDLLRALPREVRVTIAVQSDLEHERLESLLELEGVDVPEVVVTGGALTAWARDRTLAIGDGRRVDLMLPAAAEVPNGYEGDLTAAAALAGGELRCVPSTITFEGGDILCGAAQAFVGWHTIAMNAGDDDVEVGLARLQEAMGITIVPVGDRDPPHEHLDMYLTVLDDSTVVLGSPAAGAALLERLRALPGPFELPDHDEWSVETQHAMEPRYETIRLDLEQLGLRVLRVPILHGEEGNVLTWNNAVVERRGGTRRVYLPQYGLPPLDDAAVQVYRAAGCRVYPIDVAEIAASGGTIRCLTNVIGWDRAAAGHVDRPRPAAATVAQPR